MGALYADSLDISKIKKLLFKLKRDDLLDLSLFNLPYGLSNGAILKNFLIKNLIATRFNELKIPFIAVATNLKTDELTAFSSGNLKPRFVLQQHFLVFFYLLIFIIIILLMVV